MSFKNTRLSATFLMFGLLSSLGYAQQACDHTIGDKAELSTPEYSFGAGKVEVLRGGHSPYALGFRFKDVKSYGTIDTAYTATKSVKNDIRGLLGKRRFPYSLVEKSAYLRVEGSLYWDSINQRSVGATRTVFVNSSKLHLISFLNHSQMEVWSAKDIFAGPRLVDWSKELSLDKEHLSKVKTVSLEGSNDIYTLIEYSGDWFYDYRKSLRYVLLKINPETASYEVVRDFGKTAATFTTRKAQSGWPGNYTEWDQTLINQENMIERKMSLDENRNMLVIESKYLKGSKSIENIEIPISEE